MHTDSQMKRKYSLICIILLEGILSVAWKKFYEKEQKNESFVTVR